jgi:penicillin-binding protein 2
VDARGRVVREAGARQDLLPEAAPPLYTNIDLDLQRFVVEIFGDSLIGGVVAMDPKSGAVLALHSAPTFDPNRFIGGIPADYWRALNEDGRRPLYNKAIKGTYAPASTWKLATAVMAIEQGLVSLDDRMPVACAGGYQYGNRRFKCWDKKGHGNVTLAQAIEVSCDVYFYQLGLKIGLSRLVAGGIEMGARDRTGIDLPSETRSIFPSAPAVEYYNRRFGARGWSNAVSLNLAIGQGENSQTVVNMARFYTALATDGRAVQPRLVRGDTTRVPMFRLEGEQLDGVKKALAGVVQRGTAAASQLRGVMLAGKTGTAQNAHDPIRDHAWFVGFAPADDARIVVAVMLEFGLHGSRAARIASKIIEHYLRVRPEQALSTEGD